MSFSRFEGMPISVLEATSLRIPCLVSDVTGNKDIVTDKSGYLFDLNSYSDFEKNFSLFISENNEALINNASKKSKNNFNLEIQAQKVFKEYF